MKWWLKVIVVITGIYTLLWAFYGLEYWHSKNAVLNHYDGVGVGCEAGPSVPAGELGIYKQAPIGGEYANFPTYILPLFITSGFGYSINTKVGGKATGYVSALGSVHEINAGYACTLQ